MGPSRLIISSSAALHDWRIIGSGGEHVVLQNASADHRSIFYSNVLRLRLNIKVRSKDHDLCALEMRLTSYLTHTFLGDEYILDSMIVILSEDTLERFRQLIDRLGRFNAYSLDRSALLVPNANMMSDRVFEIKPKWTGCSSHLCTHSSCCCSYCCHEKRRVDKSRFCSKRLFSGDFAYILDSMRCYPFKGSVASFKDRSTLALVLSGDPILRRLQKAHEHNCELARHLPKSASIDTSDYISQVASLSNASALAEFMMTSSFRDCSLFIVIDDQFDCGHPSVCVQGQTTSYRIYVIDLDIKPCSKIRKYIDCALASCHAPFHHRVR